MGYLGVKMLLDVINKQPVALNVDTPVMGENEGRRPARQNEPNVQWGAGASIFGDLHGASGRAFHKKLSVILSEVEGPSNVECISTLEGPSTSLLRRFAQDDREKFEGVGPRSAALPPPVTPCPAPSTAPLLTMRGVQKSFGATAALRGVDFAVDAGSVHALIGENGAGKSTLMRILAGADFADAGDMLLDGQPYLPADPRSPLAPGASAPFTRISRSPRT